MSILSFELSTSGWCSQRGGTGRSNVDVTVPLPRSHCQAAEPADDLDQRLMNSAVLFMLICPSSVHSEDLEKISYGALCTGERRKDALDIRMHGGG